MRFSKQAGPAIGSMARTNVVAAKAPLRSISLTLVLNCCAMLLVTLMACAYFVPPSVVAFDFPAETLWKHRQNNSVSALKQTAINVQGIELDLMFVDGQLRVAHDKGELVGSETLTEYLSALKKGNAKPRLWFDIKNVGFGNENAIRAEILGATEKYDLTGRLLVESPNPTRMLRLCQAPLICSVWMQNTGNPIRRIWTRMKVRSFSKFANLAAVSIDYRHHKVLEQIMPSSFPALTYTFPNVKLAQSYPHRARYEVLLAD